MYTGELNVQGEDFLNVAHAAEKLRIDKFDLFVTTQGSCSGSSSNSGSGYSSGDEAATSNNSKPDENAHGSDDELKENMPTTSKKIKLSAEPVKKSRNVLKSIQMTAGIPCPHCEKVLKSRDSLRKHVYICPKNPAKELRFKCTRCSKTFVRKERLNDHESTHDPKPQFVIKPSPMKQTVVVIKRTGG